MKAYVLLGLAIAAPVLAQDGKSPEDAAKFALETCVNHSRSLMPIEIKNELDLENKGLKFQRDAPEFLQSTKSTNMGIGEYAKTPSTAGEIWSIGYDSRGCMVVTLAAPVAEVEKGYIDFFGRDKIWRSERAPASKRQGERLLLYKANPRRNLALTATISLRDADNMTTVTISAASK